MSRVVQRQVSRKVLQSHHGAACPLRRHMPAIIHRLLEHRTSHLGLRTASTTHLPHTGWTRNTRGHRTDRRWSLRDLQCMVSCNGLSKIQSIRIHSVFGHICRLLENTFVSEALHLPIEAFTGSPPAADCKTPVYPSMSLSSQVSTICCGDRYNP